MDQLLYRCQRFTGAVIPAEAGIQIKKVFIPSALSQRAYLFKAFFQISLIFGFFIEVTFSKGENEVGFLKLDSRLRGNDGPVVTRVMTKMIDF